MELIKETAKHLIELFIFFSAGVFLAYMVTNSFLTDGHKITREFGLIVFVVYSLLLPFGVKFVLDFSHYISRNIYKKVKLERFKQTFILSYYPFIFAFFVSIYLFIKSKSLYNLALNGEIDFYQSEFINIRFIPITLLIAFALILISKIFILKSKKISLIWSGLVSMITTLISFVLFLIAVGILKVLAYLVLAVFNLTGGIPFGA